MTLGPGSPTAPAVVLLASPGLFLLLVFLLHEHSSISFGKSTLTKEEADRALLDRAKLRIGVLIATSDNEVSELEAKKLRDLATGMGHRLGDLDDRWRRELRAAALTILLADGRA